jgi:hypothetical protein
MAPATLASPREDMGGDLKRLREEALDLVRSMAGDIWTAHTVSDPGVTILEQLCSALAALSERAGLPVEDLLAAPGTGRPPLWRQALYPARAMFTCNPVTVQDLRRLVLDRVPGIGNVWFEPCPPPQCGGVDGLYTVHVLPSHPDPLAMRRDRRPAALTERVRRCYAAHRSLCEDIHEIRVLRPVRTRIAAELQIDDGADATSVLADIRFALGLMLAPQPRRTSLEALRGRGMATDAIFAGPLMLRGFIEAGELGPRPARLEVGDILHRLATIAGVVSVDRLSVQIGDAEAVTDGCGALDIEDGTFLALDAAGTEAGSGVTLLRGGLPAPVDGAQLERTLGRLWAMHRRTHKLWAAYQRDYGAPVGQIPEFGTYRSVQELFPAVYQVGRHQVPLHAPLRRHAQARQLQGFLMPFDQLMADYTAQLAALPKLLSPGAGGGSSTAFRSLRDMLPDTAALLSDDYEARLAELAAGADDVAGRQDAILDLLLSLHGERPRPPLPLAGGAPEDMQIAARLRAKRELLTQLVPATRDRGRGFNYRSQGPMRGAAGLEIHCRIALALLDADRAVEGMAVVEHAELANFGRRLPAAQGEGVARNFLPVDFMLPAEGVADGPSPLAGRRVTAALLVSLADVAQYRIGTLPQNGRISLACRDAEGAWWEVDEFASIAEALAATVRLLQHAGRSRHRSLHLVEWTLLRWAADPADAARFGFRVTAVLSASPQEVADPIWCRRAEAILREHVPAHIALVKLYLHGQALNRFQRLHAAWISALRGQNQRAIAEATLHLRRFLVPTLPGPSRNT